MRQLTVAGYDVWGLLGEGGMSEVWLAKHEGLAIPVIIKTLRAALRAQGASARILSEARLMARVASPRIVRALDAGQLPSGDGPYLVQEYVDGLDLAELDRRRRESVGLGLPLWFVCLVMSEVCTGLRAAHQAGVIHRDLKPSNVFGEPEGGIRLGDFGIAVARSEGAPLENAGTPRFMAPEQIRGAEIGRFTDVWGAAATACDLRYDHPPFASVEAAIDPNIGPDLPRPTSPAEAYFQDVLRRMLAKNPRERSHDILEPLGHFQTLSKALEPPLPTAQRIETHTLLLGSIRLAFVVGDIADATADAIVASANFELKMRSGVGDALRRRGGEAIEEEALAAGEQPLGACVRTRPGTLATKHVFHAVSAWNEVSCVGRAFERALLLAEEQGCRSLAGAALGTGAGRVGIEACANAMMKTLRWHVLLGGSRLRELTMWFDSEAKRRAFQDIAEEILGVRSIGQPDFGLRDEALPTPEGATCLDPDTL